MSSLDAAIYNEARLAAERSKNRRLIFRRVVTASEVLTLPAGAYDIVAVGAGGSGGRATGTDPRATGGGGPAWARDWGTFAAPTDVTVTIGARATGVASGTGATAGNTGGTTTVTGIVNAISLTGGQAGQASISSTADLAGGAGGEASGGKIRANGGRGGNIVSTTGGGAATGGGAVDIFCLGANRTRGGDTINKTSTTVTSTGGAGVGGRGGDSTAATSYSTAGGGAGGDAKDVAAAATATGPTINGEVGDGIAPSDASVADIIAAFPVLCPIGSGTSTSATIPASGGGSSNGTDTAAVSIPFGGTGGGRNSAADGQSKTSARGGGSGGQITATAANAQLTGAGGAAFVVISVYTEVS